MNRLRCVKGMHDILPGEMPAWHYLEDTYRDLVERYGYEEIRTPVLEPIELFVRGIGEETDIVEKEMYAFKDKGEAHLALRPEGTASVIRAYLQHNLGGQNPVNKLYYLGPMFRRERPAKGRYRQFFQAGAELIGVEEPTADAEIIDMAVQFLRELGIENVRVQLNSLGDGDTRPRYRSALNDHFETKKQDLCSDCQRRLETNALRVLDCKVKRCKEIAAEAPSVLDFLSDDAKAHFESLQALLKENKTPFEIDNKMVRGLDYYTRTIFEVQGESESLGAQATIVGGGRYNNLVHEFGGKPTATIGFAFGIERLLIMLGDLAKKKERTLFFIVGVGDNGLTRAGQLARKLRAFGIKTEVSYKSSSLRSQLKKADKYHAAVTLISGEDEAARGAVTWRDMVSGDQEEIAIEALTERLRTFK